MSKYPSIEETIEHLTAAERLEQEADAYKDLANQARHQAQLSFDEQCVIDRFMANENEMATMWSITMYPQVTIWSIKEWQKNGATKAIKNLRKRGLVLMPKKAEYQLHPDLYKKLKAIKDLIFA